MIREAKTTMSVIVFTGGGTAGHYAPNIAIMEAVKNDFEGIFYIGSENGPERAAMKRLGISYYPIATAKLERRITASNALIPFKLAKGIREAKKILDRKSVV